jgi:hypothetical protein
MLHVYLSPRTRERHRQWEVTLAQKQLERREALLAQKERQLEQKEKEIEEKEREVEEMERLKKAKAAADLQHKALTKSTLSGERGVELTRDQQQQVAGLRQDSGSEESAGFVDWLTEKIMGSSMSSDQGDDDSEVRANPLALSRTIKQHDLSRTHPNLVRLHHWG